MRRLFNLKTVVTIFRRTVGAFSMLAGLVGLVFASLLFNPVSVEGWINVEQSHSAVISSIVLVMGMILLWKGVMANLSAFWKVLRATPMAILTSPMSLYRQTIVGRNWLLRKIDYLQTESEKWKRTFTVMKSPYSLLRSLGFSPQMAVGLLFAGTAASTGVVVNETVFAERSFNRGDSGIYAASVVGNNASLDVPTSYVEGDNTLRIDLGATPVREITIENVSVGTVFTGSALPSGDFR